MSGKAGDQSANVPKLRPSIMDSADPIIDNLDAQQLESLFLHAQNESNNLSRSTEVMTQNVVMAKMVNYSIRMLHSNGWHPRTIIRAMVHVEAGVANGSERGIKSAMYQAMREKRDENRARKAAKDAAVAAAANDEQEETAVVIGGVAETADDGTPVKVTDAVDEPKPLPGRGESALQNLVETVNAHVMARDNASEEPIDSVLGNPAAEKEDQKDVEEGEQKVVKEEDN